MGGGIARWLADQGRAVTVYDPDPGALRLAEANFAGMRPAMWTEDAGTAVEEAEVVFEAVPEDLNVKRRLFESLVPYVKEGTVVASNTSTFPLGQLAADLPYGHRMVVAHFFQPAHIVPLVEVVRGPETEETAVASMMGLLTELGKVPVLLKKDIPGFLVNRLQAAVLREACYLLDSGAADAAEIDQAMREGAGLRWALQGPFEITDFGGIDVWEKVAERLFPDLSAERNVPKTIARLREAGNLGVKSGRGWYEYGDTEQAKRKLQLRDARLSALAAWKRDNGSTN